MLISLIHARRENYKTIILLAGVKKMLIIIKFNYYEWFIYSPEDALKSQLASILI